MMYRDNHDITNYIDDIVFCNVPSKIQASYDHCLQLLHDLGLSINQKKLVPPTTSPVCVGIQIDTISRTISIPPDKLGG